MNKVNVSEIVLAIVTLLTFLACIAGVVLSAFIANLTHALAMGSTCALLAVFFGFMVRNDYCIFFGKK